MSLIEKGKYFGFSMSLAGTMIVGEEKDVDICFIALVTGKVKEDKGIIETLIGRSKKDGKKQKVYLFNEPGSIKGKRRAITEYRVVETLTFGLLTKNLAFKIHDILFLPSLILLVLHVCFPYIIKLKKRKDSVPVSPIN